jgi:hypothetical protein
MSSGPVPAPDGPGPLLAALAELAALGTADDQRALAGLRGRLHAAQLRVLVVGEAKRGKRARWSTRCSAGPYCPPASPR